MNDDDFTIEPTRNDLILAALGDPEIGRYPDFVEAIRSLVERDEANKMVSSQLVLIKHLAVNTNERNWADKRDYLIQAADRALEGLGMFSVPGQGG